MSGIFFGSEIAAEVVYDQLATRPAITGAVGTRLLGISVVPASVNLPAMLFFPVGSGYDGPISGAAMSETLVMEVKAVCVGTSTTPIRAAAEDQYTVLAGNTFEKTIGGVTYHVDFTEEAEALPTTEYENGEYRRALGTRYRVNVTRG